MDIPRISTKYIPGISMDIHGISFDVYTWYIRGISMDIPIFLLPDFSAGPCCWFHSMGTRVWVIKSVLFHAPPWQLCQGIRLPTKGSLLLSPRPLRLALRGAAGRLRCCQMGGLVFVTFPRFCVVAAVVGAAVGGTRCRRRHRRRHHRRRRQRRRRRRWRWRWHGLLSWWCRVR